MRNTYLLVAFFDLCFCVTFVLIAFVFSKSIYKYNYKEGNIITFIVGAVFSDDALLRISEDFWYEWRDTPSLGRNNIVTLDDSNTHVFVALAKENLVPDKSYRREDLEYFLLKDFVRQNHAAWLALYGKDKASAARRRDVDKLSRVAMRTQIKNIILSTPDRVTELRSDPRPCEDILDCGSLEEDEIKMNLPGVISEIKDRLETMKGDERWNSQRDFNARSEAIAWFASAVALLSVWATLFSAYLPYRFPRSQR